MIRIRRVRLGSLDVEFRAGAGFSVRIVERPGAWMTDIELEQLRNRIRAVVRDTVAGGALEYGVARGNRSLMAQAIVTLGYQREPRRPVALNALVRLPVELDGRRTDVLHLGLALVRPDCRQLGLCHRMYFLPLILGLARSRGRALWVSNVSQVPSAVGQVAEYFAEVFPGLDPARGPTPAQTAIATQLFGRHRTAFGVGHDATFDPERFVIRNAYTGGSDNLKKTFAEAAKHREQGYNDLCARTLDYTRGDDFLQVGRYTLEILLRSIAQTRTRRVRVTEDGPSGLAWSWFSTYGLYEPTEL
jgi:hypothetical protein